MKFLTAAFSLLTILFATTGFSAEIPFDQAHFDADRAAGRPVAVVFHADWCPTCRAQAPVLHSLSQTPALEAVTLYVADFDSEKSLKKALGVTKQSTIVVYKDGKETARSTGDTQQASLAELLHHAVS